MRYYTVKTGDTLAQIAQQFGITITDLKRKNKLFNNILRVGQQLEIPATPPKDTPKTHIEKDKITENNTENNIENVALIDDFPQYNNNTTPIIPQNEQKTYPHHIKVGESWHTIAKLYHTTVSELKRLNPFLDKDLRVGADMKILAQDFEKIHPEDTLLLYKHIVSRGDTLHGIAQKYKVSVEDLKKWNNLQVGLLDIGQILLIKKVEENISNPKIEMLENENEILENENEVLENENESLKNKIEILENENEALENESKVLENEINTQETENQEEKLEEEELEEEEENDFLKNIPFTQENISYQTARLIFRIENPLETSETFQNPMGMYHVSKPDDVEKIQKKLVEKGFLHAEHGETPSEIYAQQGRLPLTANFLPKTWEALQGFQESIDIPFWYSFYLKNNQKDRKDRLNFTWGVIKPNDLTHKLLQESENLVISFPHPHTGKRIKWSLSNYVVSEKTIFPTNYCTKGQSKPEIPMNVWQRLGLTLPLAEIMHGLITELGAFDAFWSNEKDLKYGILPFKNEEILEFITYTAQKSPALFQECFAQFGIQIDEKNNLVIHTDQFNTNTPLEKIRGNHIIIAILGRAGFYLPMITLQLDFLLQNYIFPSLSLEAKIKTNINVYTIDLVDVLANAEGLKVLFRTTLKYGLDKTEQLFQNALQFLANARNLHTPAHWQEVKVQDVIWQVSE